jgi:hypothetical protein
MRGDGELDAIKTPLGDFLLVLLDAEQCIELDAIQAPLAIFFLRGRLMACFSFLFFSFRFFCRAEWDQENWGPRKVAQTTRTGFGFLPSRPQFGA